MTIIPICKSSPSFVFYGKFNSFNFLVRERGGGGRGGWLKEVGGFCHILLVRYIL